MRTIHAAAATLASAALLGATTEPHTGAGARRDMPAGPARPRPPPARASGGARRGERRLVGAAPARRHALPRAADGVRPRAVLPRKPARARSADGARPHARATGALVSWSRRQYCPRPGPALLGRFGAGRRARRARSRPAAGAVPLAPAASGGLSDGGDGRRHRPRASRPHPDLEPAQRRPSGRARHLDGRRVGGSQRLVRAALPAAAPRRPRRRAPALAPARRMVLQPGHRLALRRRIAARGGRLPERRPYATRIALVHTADGALELLPAPLPASRGELAWSPSGEWLYVPVAGRRIAAYGRATGASSRCRFGWPTT